MNSYERTAALIFRFLGVFITLPTAIAFLFIFIGLFLNPPPTKIKTEMLLIGNIHLFFVALGIGLMILSKSLSKWICKGLD